VRLACVVVLLLLGVVQALLYRRTLNPDGVAYLDLSDSVLAGRWGDLVQGYWSPVYPVLLAMARALGGRGALDEPLIAHVVNLAGYAFALVAWGALMKRLGQRGTGIPPFDSALGVAVGYGVFGWAILWLTSLHFVTPDLWLAGWIFAAAAAMLRHRDDESWKAPVMLGAALGAGYLTKSVLLPVAPFFVVGAALVSPVPRRLRRAFISIVVLTLVAGPWIAVISRHEGRFTFGDNGRYNYQWFVTSDRWLSPDPVRELGIGASVFPRVTAEPAMYAWPDDGATYAPWRDPSRWHGAMRMSVDVGQQRRVLSRSWGIYWFYLAPWAVVLLAMMIAGVRTTGWDALSGATALALPSVVGLAGYALIFVEGRYIAPFFALLLVGKLSALRAPDSFNVRAVIFGAALAVALWMLLGIRIPSTLELGLGGALLATLCVVARPRWSVALLAGVALLTLGGAHVLRRGAMDLWQLREGRIVVDPALEVRTALRSDDMAEDVMIGIIGDGPSAAVWAREVRARIVAEVPASQGASYWAATDSARSLVADAARRAGASELIAVAPLPAVLPAGWRRLPGGNVARYALSVP
jgi:hypothetical protein